MRKKCACEKQSTQKTDPQVYDRTGLGVQGQGDRDSLKDRYKHHKGWKW
jgi:hypothetical protein